MRKLICVENALYEDVFLKKGAVLLPEKIVPIRWVFDPHTKPVGQAEDFRREFTGEITAEITSHHDEDVAEAWPEGMYEFALSGYDVMKMNYHGVNEISRIKLDGLVLRRTGVEYGSPHK